METSWEIHRNILKWLKYKFVATFLASPLKDLGKIVAAYSDNHTGHKRTV
jgi:hypothetical protein